MASISRTPSIYQIRHIASGKVYVGSAINPRKRWKEHSGLLRRGIHHSLHLQSAWGKYGEAAFVFEIIEPVLFVEDLIVREQYWIDALRASEPANGYNMTPLAGSTLGTKRTDETRARIADAVKAQWKNDPAVRERMTALGKARAADPAMGANISAKAKARWADPEVRERMSEQGKVRCADPLWRKGASERGIARYTDPAARVKVSERTKAQFADPVQRANHAAGQKARYADPAERAKASERWNDPDFRARQMALRAARKKEKL